MKCKYEFWISDNHGIIRVRENIFGRYHPEIVRDGKWITGSAYVMDAITGMGEDPWSCGEYAFKIDEENAFKECKKLDIDPFGPNTG
jgi:hypothetical protein